jgi:ABC-2 type transport system permease protein
MRFNPFSEAAIFTGNVLRIAFRDGLGFFRRPQGFAFLAVFALIAGFFFYNQIVTFSTICSHAGPSPALRRQLSINEQVISSFFMDICIVLMIMVPMITTRSFADEEESGSITLLLTAPVSPWSLVTGKFIGSLIPIWTMILITLPHVISTFILADPELLPVLSGYAGLFLLSMAMAALGNMASAFAGTRVFSMAGGFGIFLLFWIVGWSDGYSEGTVAVLSRLSTSIHLRTLMSGMVTLSDILFFPSLVLAALCMTVAALKIRKWRD